MLRRFEHYSFQSGIEITFPSVKLEISAGYEHGSIIKLIYLSVNLIIIRIHAGISYVQ